MTLNDREIAQALRLDDLYIWPYSEACLQPASYDMHLGDNYKTFAPRGFIDPRMESVMIDHVANEDKPMVLQPGQFALATTIETVALSAELVGRLEGKSSLARLGLIVHEAGFFDPGFRGQCTLEMFNLAPVPLRLYPGMKIVQMAFERLSGPAKRPYGSPGLGSKYLDQTGPTASRAHQEA
jgi:dCTP deaminase